MKLLRPLRPSPRDALAAAPRRAPAAMAMVISCSSSPASAEKSKSSSKSNNKRDPVNVVASMPQLFSPEAKNTVALLRSLGTSDVVHTGGESFLSHLVGVYGVLKSWGAPEYLCLAGLAHSIYSTEGFQGFCLNSTAETRARVANVLGSLEAEKIAHVFCCTDRGSQDEDLFKSRAEGWKEGREHRWRLRKGAPLAPAPVLSPLTSSSSSSSPIFVPGTEPENPYSDGSITLSHGEWLEFTTLTLADWMEQVESAALKESTHFNWGVGQAWGYRRRAFAAMAEALGGLCAATHAEVMAREPEGASRAWEWPGW